MTRISFRPKALYGLQQAPRKERLRIQSAIDILEQGTFPPHSKKLEDTPQGYRLRISRWRVLFVLKDGEAEIVDIFIKKGRSDYRRRI